MRMAREGIERLPDTFLDRTESYPNLHALCHDRTRSDARTREPAREPQTAR